MRGVWGALALVHAWPVILVLSRLVSTPTLGDLGSLALLSIVLPLFVLKAIDSPRVRTSRPVLEPVVWLIAAALVHSGPVGDAAIAEAPAVTALAVATGIGVGVGSSRVRRRVKGWINEFVGGLSLAYRTGLAAADVCGWLPGEARAGRGALWAIQGFAARPPPVVLSR